MGLRRRIATRSFRFVARDHGRSALQTPWLQRLALARDIASDLHLVRKLGISRYQHQLTTMCFANAGSRISLMVGC